jgi:hypothetical protein
MTGVIDENIKNIKEFISIAMQNKVKRAGT